MTPVELWAQRHGVSKAALADLLTVWAPPPVDTPNLAHTSEAYVQSLVRREAPQHDVWLTRNNVGAAKMVNERTGAKSFVRFGLANETTTQNLTVKSGDLIGIDGRPIEPWEVGRPRGRFVSRECKHAGWSPGEDAVREEAQMNWVRLVTRYGGDAKIVRGEGSF